MIKFSNLSKDYDGKLAVDNISLEISAGEIFGFLGPNGAGKTTTVKMLTGMMKPSSGTATIGDFDLVSQSQEVKKIIGYVPESGALFESLTALEFLELMAELHHMERSQAQRRMNEFLNLFGLADNKDQLISQFSKGMKQKVLLISALLHKPEVLFLDEPLNGLDANTALVFKQLLKRMAEQGKTILFCSHILEVVERICSKIALINDGSIISVGTPGEIIQQSGEATLEHAFSKLTGNAAHESQSVELLQALDSI